MKRNIKITSDRANRILGQLIAEKKKAVLALSLICVMIFMWIRALAKKAPESAKAASKSQMLGDGSDSDTHLQISYTELPNVSGRNDVITKDFFASNGWRSFLKAKEGNSSVDIGEVSVISDGGDDEVIALVVQRLKLEAIILGTSPRAFINDELLGLGDKLFIRDGDTTYECEVVKITENTVVIRYGQAQIELKLIRSIEVTGDSN
jgi:hypothetical protein